MGNIKREAQRKGGGVAYLLCCVTLVVSDSLWPYELHQNTGVGYHFQEWERNENRKD